MSIFPLVPGVIPFAMISGMSALEAGLDPVMAQLSSMIIFAGASQVAAMQLISSHASALVIILTIWIINLRFMMYSAALANRMPPSRAPSSLLAYILTDQSFAISISRFELNQIRPEGRVMFYLGSSVTIWLVWQLATGLGIMFGAVIPSSWSLDFGVSLCFIAILIPAIKDFPALLAAVTGGCCALLFADLPYNLGLIISSVIGITLGYLASQRLVDRQEASYDH